jgi:hypothetical protein
MKLKKFRNQLKLFLRDELFRKYSAMDYLQDYSTYVILFFIISALYTIFQIVFFLIDIFVK